MEIVKFSEFSASELTRLWNEGFKGYAFDMTMSVDAFIKRIPENQFSMEASIAICDQGKPVGFVMNGFRTVDGRLTAWNGGTGIIPEYRGRGLGKQLIGAALDVCREKGAEVALLEALSENEPAIKLYAKMGYRWIGDLRFYEQKEGLKPDALASEGADAYQFRFGLPGMFSGSSFRSETCRGKPIGKTSPAANRSSQRTQMGNLRVMRCLEKRWTRAENIRRRFCTSAGP
ncbi:GNAT family N-acetyltransferase [Paenibacillus sp. JTLBN-2024]